MANMAAFWESVYNEGSFVSPLWSIPGFLISYCVPDFMHTCCLGILQYLSGNVMFELFRSLNGTYKNWTHACGLLENMMKLGAKSIGIDVPFHNLTIGMIIPAAKGKPKMKLKAAEGRYFLRVLHVMLRDFFDKSESHDILRFNCVDALVQVYREMDHWGDGGVSSVRMATLSRKHLLL